MKASKYGGENISYLSKKTYSLGEENHVDDLRQLLCTSHQIAFVDLERYNNADWSLPISREKQEMLRTEHRLSPMSDKTTNNSRVNIPLLS